MVPPPTVPISIDGMVQLIYKSSLVGPLASIKVIQFELPTFWAASWRGQGKYSTVPSLTTTEQKAKWGPQAHLAACNVDSSDDVRCVGVIASYAPGHGRTHQVLVNVYVNHRFRCRL